MNEHEARVREFITAREGMPLPELVKAVVTEEHGELMAADDAIPKGLPERYSQLIFEDHNESVYLLQWPQGKAGTEIHDHGESEAVVVVLRGTVKETVYEEDGRERVQFHPAGTVLHIGKPYIHKFEDGGDGEALSLHFYDPPLTHMNYFQHGPDGRMVKSGEWSENT